MKLTKRLLSLVMVLALLASLSAAAFAEEAQYKTTRDFLAYIADVDGFTYEVLDPIQDDSDNYEVVRVKYSGDISDYTSTMVLLFCEDCEEVQIYCYNLINFAEEDLSDVLVAVNNINAKGTGVKLFVDSSDNSVTAEMYQILCENDAADLAVMALGFMIGYTDTAYEQLQDYAA